MFVFFRCSRPDKALMTGRKHTAGQVRRGVRFKPSNVIEDMHAFNLKRIAALINRMIGAGYPKRSARTQLSVTGRNPCLMKEGVGFHPLRPVPLALIHRHHPPALTGKAVIRQIIRRVRENHVNGVVGDMLIQFRQHITVVKLESLIV